MRALVTILAACLAGGCTTAQDPARDDAMAQAQLQQLIAGKTAGRPMSCLSTFRADDMVRISENLIAFRDGPARLYVNRLRRDCFGLANSNYALVTRNLGGTGLCSGDIAYVTDVSSGQTVGTCVLGDFVPYTRP